jgi:VWFA-related protein
MKLFAAIALFLTPALLALPLLDQPLPAQPLLVQPLSAQAAAPQAGGGPDAGSAPAEAQSADPQSAAHTSSITVQSSLVLVPALVKTKSGAIVFTLQASDFSLTDNGVPQKLTLEQGTDGQPLALVIAVETGGDAAARLQQYRNLGPLLDAIVGNVPHQIAVVGFDSTPTLLHGFTPNTDFIAHSLDVLDAGNPGDAMLDALAFSVDLLRKQPPAYRRAILLLGETIDHGSHTTLTDALRDISDTNTIIYSVGFNSTRSEMGPEARKFGYAGLPPLPPGPEHGCFSRESTGKDENGDPIPPPESRATQNFDCLAELAPPLRLARMAYLAVTNGLRRNTPETVAKLTGGEYFKFKDVKTLQRDLITISNHVPNRYVLSFRPQTPLPGFHTIDLTLKDRPDLVVEARDGYWVEDTSAPAQP